MYDSAFKCARFIHEQLYNHMDKLLRSSLEGPSDSENHRYCHPVQVAMTLIDQDDSNALTGSLADLDVDCLRYLISCCLGIIPGVVDVISRTYSISILTSALSGTHPWMVNPSCAPTHFHTVASTKQRRFERVEDNYPPLKLFHKIRGMLSLVVEIGADTIYKSSRDDFIPSGENGRSFLSRILRLFIAIADLDSDFIK